MALLTDIARSHVVARQLKDRLLGAFKGAGWRVDLESSGAEGRSRPDMVVHRGPRRYAVELKVAREPRRSLLQAMLADAILQARVHAQEFRASPLAVVAAARISPAAAHEIREYAQRFAAGVAWGLLDSETCFDLHGEGLEAIHPEPAKVGEANASLSRPPPDLFSDLGQWMLKVFMADEIGAKYLGAPCGHVRNASHLASLASASLPSASRLVSQLRHLNFIESEHDGLRLVRIADLLQSWRVSSSATPHEIGARWFVPPKDSAEQLSINLAAYTRSPFPVKSADARQGYDPAREGPRACLGLFAASEKLGFRFAHGTPLHLYLEDISVRVLVEQFSLAPVRSGEHIDVIVRRPRFPEAVFRACVIRDGVPAADIIQCWIDISSHPARGREHAEQIWRRVLVPRLALEANS
jgi:hypothetical protein